MAVKFDLFQNCEQGNNSTGLNTDGASPTVPATTLGGGVDLHGADAFHVHMIHDGTTPTIFPLPSVAIRFRALHCRDWWADRYAENHHLDECSVMVCDDDDCKRTLIE